ncbi:YbaL family putative K(+) efflux transporter [Magnetospirillum aberrantis]|uniref:Kef family K(+) transporter n=1 Tax=Magnetospirillum aberrantis SpK TaxID=908842 RepID=A0A7C9UTC6_9PROT|nr:YbaL family putative K(+) efflux transporter [Magnetospirillum aberrantis]NFV79948.1 Kef family K(+) transporter [Magnetospirillum aberrantis SpK]
MPHLPPLITTIVAGIGLAFVFGAIAARLRIPPLVGYLVAGIVAGPFTPGFVADQMLAPQLAEIGVILLMFGVGLHFSLKDLLSVSAIAIPGAIAQIGVATVLGLGLALAMGWTVTAGLVFGLALSVASTVVLLRALQERRELDTQRGRIAVGWLIVEDLAMVLALVLLPALAGIVNGQGGLERDWLASRLDVGLGGMLILTFLKVAAFVLFMLLVGRRVIPWILHGVAHMGSRELFRLAVLAIALGVAFGAAKLFGVSLALGAFFAGMVLSESELSHQAAQESLPLRDAFAVLFFVSVGMLFDPHILIEEPLPLLATLFIILAGKSFAAFVIVRVFRHPLRTALTISASLAQIGEFSFILAELGIGLELLPERARGLILAGAIMSILLNPLSFTVMDWLLKKLETRRDGSKEPAEAADETRLDTPPSPVPQSTTLQNHIILVGYGRVGSLVGNALLEKKLPFLVIEDTDLIVKQLRKSGIEVIDGNAAKPEVLAATNLPEAACMIVAIPNAFEAGHAIRQARTANPALRIIARAHSDPQVEHLSGLGADIVIMGEREVARGITERLFAPIVVEETAEPETQAAS